MADTELEVRQAVDGDLDAILELLRVSMGRAHDERFEQLFRWKHLENRFGRSPMWLAVDGDRIVGLRVFMRWEFERGTQTFRAVRAVDTATHPDYQGRGIFTKLTLGALPDLEAEGVDFVFNTPNDKSRPGYLKMGWQQLGRLPASIRPTRAGGLLALRGARAAAAHWSEEVEWGRPAADVLADEHGLAALCARRSPSQRLRTRLDVEALQWRYGTPLLGYRAVTLADGGVEDGVAFVRVRRRGDAREVVVALALTTGESRRASAALLRRVARLARRDADYLIALERPPAFVPLPALGPVLTARTVAAHAPERCDEFALTLGDVELF